MKPSYEELEEQLNRSRRLCDAALANERVWETTMMQACGEDGPKSVADKFAELEARCAELAAENAALKKYICDECYVENIKTGATKCAGLGMPETPATDAFLAEVRASELDSLAGVAETMMVKFANQGASEIPEAKGWEMIHRQASQRAAQLRKGVQS
ncbi:hypothetical protein POW01_18120 [Enterobacter cloacae]|uniref:hypothetical protein n=1 Tax=Enterobacter cloacae TaxID=550 RepID=UPI002FF447B6